jgi:hypothetical protein
VTAVQVVLPVVFTYILVLVELPSVLKYRLPCAALNVGAPDPKNTPRLAVLDIKYPALEFPPAGGAVALIISTCPSVLILPPVTLPIATT